MDQRFFDAMQENPIIAAVKHDSELECCLSRRDGRVVFVLYGDICSIPGIVTRIHQAGKLAIVHADLIQGLAPREIAIDYLCKNAGADGIISTRKNLIQRAKELKMYTIWRLFMIDSMSLAEADEAKVLCPDFLEILPGVLPEIIRQIRERTGLPVLAGGLICTKQDVLDALNAGATAISTTNEAVWDM